MVSVYLIVPFYCDIVIYLFIFYLHPRLLRTLPWKSAPHSYTFDSLAQYSTRFPNIPSGQETETANKTGAFPTCTANATSEFDQI